MKTPDWVTKKIDRAVRKDRRNTLSRFRDNLDKAIEAEKHRLVVLLAERQLLLDSMPQPEYHI